MKQYYSVVSSSGSLAYTLDEKSEYSGDGKILVRLSTLGVAAALKHFMFYILLFLNQHTSLGTLAPALHVDCQSALQLTIMGLDRTARLAIFSSIYTVWKTQS